MGRTFLKGGKQDVMCTISCHLLTRSLWNPQEGDATPAAAGAPEAWRRECFLLTVFCIQNIPVQSCLLVKCLITPGIQITFLHKQMVSLIFHKFLPL